jgi:type II secretory pathway pseudopilin PulG
MSVGHRHRRRAFTLLEMIVATGLMVVLMTTMFWFYRTSILQRAEGTATSRDVQLARVILERISAEIRQSVPSMSAFGPGVFGYKDAVEINTLVIPDKKLSEIRGIRDRSLPGQFDLQQIRYYIAWDDVNVDTNGDPRALGLVRRVSRTYLRDVVFLDDQGEPEATDDAELEFKEELYAPEIKYLEVLYHDGNRWWDRWELTQGNSLPQMVRVTIGFEPELPESEEMEIVDEDFLKDEEDLEPLQQDRYSTVVRLVHADLFYGSRLQREATALGESAGMD